MAVVVVHLVACATFVKSLDTRSAVLESLVTCGFLNTISMVVVTCAYAADLHMEGKLREFRKLKKFDFDETKKVPLNTLQILKANYASHRTFTDPDPSNNDLKPITQTGNSTPTKYSADPLQKTNQTTKYVA